MLTALLVLLGAVLVIFAGEAVRGQCQRMLDVGPSAPAVEPAEDATALMLPGQATNLRRSPQSR